MTSETRLVLLGIALATFAGVSFRLVKNRSPVSSVAKPADNPAVSASIDAGAEPPQVKPAPLRSEPTI